MDVPWVLRVADFEKGVNQGALSFGLQCDVEFDHRPCGGFSKTLPVGRNVIPSVLDQHLIPMCGRVGE